MFLITKRLISCSWLGLLLETSFASTFSEVLSSGGVRFTIYSGLTQASIRGIAQMHSLPFR